MKNIELNKLISKLKELEDNIQINDPFNELQLILEDKSNKIEFSN